MMYSIELERMIEVRWLSSLPLLHRIEWYREAQSCDIETFDSLLHFGQSSYLSVDKYGHSLNVDGL